MYKAVKKIKCPSGLVLLVQPISHVASVSVGLQINVGARDERMCESGIGHLIEHMLFQGTSKRSVKSLGRIISAVGGQLDACTGRESTVIYAKLPAEHLSLALDVIADMIFHSTLDPVQLRKEKAVINEEIRMVEDTPDELIHDLFSQALWPKQSLGRSILGTKRSLARINRSQIKDFLQSHYQPNQMILSIAGQVTVPQCQTLVEKWFRPKKQRPQSVSCPSEITSPSQSIWKKQRLEQVHACLGVTTFPYADARRLALIALSTILGGGANSRLFFSIREQRGLSYNTYTFTDFYRDTGLFGVYIACHRKKLNTAMNIIKYELNKVVKHGVSERELKDVKNQLKGNLIISMESTSSYMWSMLNHETYQKSHPTMKQLLLDIDQLTGQALKQVACDCFKNRSLIAAVLGPFSQPIQT